MIRNSLYRHFKEVLLHRIFRKFSLIPLKSYSYKDLLFGKAIKMALFGKDDIISDNIAFLGYYEWELSSIIKELSKDAKIMVDAGANMGYFSLVYLANSNNGIVYSFEPNPSVFSLLSKNICINQFEARTFLHQMALSATNDDIPFSTGSSDSQSGWGHANKDSIDFVKATTIDTFFSQKEVIDVLKIDVEGFEYEVLKGASRFLESKHIENIFFEINEGMLNSNGTNGDIIFSYLEGFGYSINKLTDEIYWAKA